MSANATTTAAGKEQHTSQWTAALNAALLCAGKHQQQQVSASPLTDQYGQLDCSSPALAGSGTTLNLNFADNLTATDLMQSYQHDEDGYEFDDDEDERQFSTQQIDDNAASQVRENTSTGDQFGWPLMSTDTDLALQQQQEVLMDNHSAQLSDVAQVHLAGAYDGFAGADGTTLTMNQSAQGGDFIAANNPICIEQQQQQYSITDSKQVPLFSRSNSLTESTLSLCSNSLSRSNSMSSASYSISTSSPPSTSSSPTASACLTSAAPLDRRAANWRQCGQLYHTSKRRLQREPIRRIREPMGASTTTSTSGQTTTMETGKLIESGA